MRLREIAKAVYGELPVELEISINNISTDSRTIQEGNLFIPPSW